MIDIAGLIIGQTTFAFLLWLSWRVGAFKQAALVEALE